MCGEIADCNQVITSEVHLTIRRLTPGLAVSNMRMVSAGLRPKRSLDMKKALFAVVYLLACVSWMLADEPKIGERYVVLSTVRTKTLRAELDRVLAQGYVLDAGDASADILVLEKRSAADQRKYLIGDRLSATIEKNEYKGYRVVPWSFSNSHNSWAALLESLSEGEPQPEYKLSTTAFTRNLLKDVSEASAGGYRAIAMTGLNGQGAVMEKLPGATTTAATYELLATKKISTMEKEIAETAAKGFKVVAATGAGHEILVLMESQPEGANKRDYKVISTSKTSTFEKEINEAAAQGYRIVPLTAAALKKANLMTAGANAYEQAIIMEKQIGAPSLRYMFLGARREGTIQKELNAAPADCRIATMFLTYQEVATLLACGEVK
jgi:hypothetical protein